MGVDRSGEAFGEAQAREKALKHLEMKSKGIETVAREPGDHQRAESLKKTLLDLNL
jgi:hypothetical protein